MRKSPPPNRITGGRDGLFEGYSLPKAPLMKIPPPGPRSRKFLEYQQRNEGSAISYPRGLPMAIRRAKGATVEDMDGNRYIDFFGGAGVVNVGHGNPEVLRAAHKQIDEATHSLDIPGTSRKALVEALRKILPVELTRIFFGGPTGSDAVESAIKVAKFNTGRSALVAFEGSYHGMTTGALSVTSGHPFREGFLPLLADVHFLPYAYCYRCSFHTIPDKCQLLCAKFLDDKMEDPHSGLGPPAALLVEAIQGEGGSIVPPEGFLPALRRIADKHGVLLIIDEIQAGFCRTGRMFAFEHTETTPDIMTMSKALGGLGFPISCIAYKEHLDTLPPGKHIGTFRGNLVAYAAGAAAVRFMTKTRLATHARRLGKTMLGMLKDIEAHSAIVGEARGQGLMLGVEFVKDKGTREPAPDLAAKVRTICHRNGLLIEIGGHYFNVARFLPPLILTEPLARKGVEVFADAVSVVEKAR